MEDRRASVDEKRAMAELIEEENKIMMMDPSNMDVYIRKWWDYARMEILQRRREVALFRAAAEASSCAAACGDGGGDASVSGVGGGGGFEDTTTAGPE
jgi:uncharacterized membrane protein